MVHDHQNRLLRYVSMVVLAFFLSFCAGSTMFMHRHTVGGVTIAHSHPFAASSHTHSAQAVISFAQATQLISEEAVADNILNSPYLTYTTILRLPATPQGHINAIGRESLPAPPDDLII